MAVSKAIPFKLPHNFLILLILRRQNSFWSSYNPTTRWKSRQCNRLKVHLLHLLIVSTSNTLSRLPHIYISVRAQSRDEPAPTTWRLHTSQRIIHGVVHIFSGAPLGLVLAPHDAGDHAELLDQLPVIRSTSFFNFVTLWHATCHIILTRFVSINIE